MGEQYLENGKFKGSLFSALADLLLAGLQLMRRRLQSLHPRLHPDPD